MMKSKNIYSTPHNWPNIDLKYEDSDKILDLYLSSTKEAAKQSLEGGRAVITRAITISTFASTMALASFGAIPIVNSYLKSNKLEDFSIIGLIVSSLLWSAAALMATFSSKTQIFGSIAPEEADIAKQEFFSVPLSDAKLTLLKVQFEGMRLSRLSSRKASRRLNWSIMTLVISPAVGLLFTFYPAFYRLCCYLVYHVCFLLQKFSHFALDLTR